MSARWIAGMAVRSPSVRVVATAPNVDAAAPGPTIVFPVTPPGVSTGPVPRSGPVADVPVPTSRPAPNRDRGPLAGLIRRAPNRDSLEAAWAEMTTVVDGLNMVSFIVNLRRRGRVDDGGDGFTWADFVEVIGNDDGKKFVKDRWRDEPGKRWGEDQEIRGQHEWIMTDSIPYVIRTVVLSHAGANLDPWLAACDMLRIPTSDVLLVPTIAPSRVAEVNAAPTTFSTSRVGGFSGHVGALYHPPATPKNDPLKNAYSPLTKGAAKGFHNPMNALLKAHLNDATNDLAGFLKAISGFQDSKLWNGSIPDLKEGAARQVPNDLRGGQTSTAPLYGSYRSTYAEGVGISTTFTEATTLHDLQRIAAESKERNTGAMQHRVNALVQMLQPPTAVPASQWRRGAGEPGYVVDSVGKTVEDYDAEAGYDALTVEPTPHAPYDPIVDDPEPDEEYTKALAKSEPAAVATPGAWPQQILDDYGRARSKLQHEQEQKIERINAEVKALFLAAYQTETTALRSRVEQELKLLHPADPQIAAKQDRIRAQAAAELRAIDNKYQAEGQRHFTQYVEQKRRRDLQLYAEHPTQITHQALTTLLEAYLRDTTQLLDAYVADIKKTLGIS